MSAPISEQNEGEEPMMIDSNDGTTQVLFLN